MPKRRQHCEGQDWREAKADRRPCFSQAHWKVTYTALDFTAYLCGQCHALAELYAADKGTPRDQEYQPGGFPRDAGHAAANRYHDQFFTHVRKPPRARPEQIDFEF